MAKVDKYGSIMLNGKLFHKLLRRKLSSRVGNL